MLHLMCHSWAYMNSYYFLLTAYEHLVIPPWDPALDLFQLATCEELRYTIYKSMQKLSTDSLKLILNPRTSRNSVLTEN